MRTHDHPDPARMAPAPAEQPENPPQTRQDGPESPATAPDAPKGPGLTSGIRMAVESLELDREGWSADRISLRCTGAWAEWLGTLSIFARVPTATIIDQAVTRYAESIGFFPAPPSRLRSNPAGTATSRTRADFRGYPHEKR